MSPGRASMPAATIVVTMPIAAIVVGERIRKDMGDIAGLAASMGSELGLLQPIVGPTAS
jgi:hypothetical protein